MSIQLFVRRDQLQAGSLILQGEEHHYLSHVRRLSVGDPVVLLDGQGSRANATITSIDAANTTLEVGDALAVPPPAFSLSMAPALIKGDRMDQTITKMVELGVASIRPITTERTIVRLKGEKLLLKQKRFEALAVAAARQSQNAHPATIAAIVGLPDLLNDLPDVDLKLIPAVRKDVLPLSDALPDGFLRSALVLIGPEGGFTDAEVSQAVKAGFTAVGLGERILRAETASIAMASILSFRYGDVGS